MNQAQPGDIVRIHFTGRLENGSVFGSSENEEPIQLALGNERMIPGLDRVLVGMQVGEKKRATIPAEEGFGPRRPELQQRVPRKALPENVKVGDRLPVRIGDSTLYVCVRALDEDTAVVDGNHPLAGQPLTFDIEMVAIESAGLQGGRIDSSDAVSTDALVETNRPPSPRGNLIVTSDRIRRRQWWMTCLMVTIPALATVVAIAWAFVRPIGYVEIGLFVLMVTFTGGLGVDVGYHRFLVHRSFDAKAVVRFILAAAGAMSFQGPPLYWAAVHRRHHEFSDGMGDPHSPNSGNGGLLARIRDLWHAHIGWMANHDIPSTIHYVPDLLKDRTVMWVNRHYLLIASLGIVLPAVAAGVLLRSWEGAVAGLLWGGLVRVFFTSNATWSINSICHVFGTRTYECRDDSRNVALLAIPTFGGSWHNNHHAFPTSARHGMQWWQLDIGYLMIQLMSSLGLVRNVRTVKQ